MYLSVIMEIVYVHDSKKFRARLWLNILHKKVSVRKKDESCYGTDIIVGLKSNVTFNVYLHICMN